MMIKSATEESSSVPGEEKLPLSTPVNVGTIRTVTLYGAEIVSLTISGQERLCLAQISNTLLQKYSYNEIHNRRVALGITCVQCTPVQLDQLRRAGAMPVSSRRCGMITKREAERLVKSFLDEISPPKLPLNFVFNVRHSCGWGGQGQFLPSRYNSSRAKCIKCSLCLVFFSPNKFIFHCHKPELEEIQRGGLTYHHPDAANFNAWRRHLVLNDASANENVVHAWEDVKAMFNGGNRKRLLNNQSGDIYANPSQRHNNSSDISEDPAPPHEPTNFDFGGFHSNQLMLKNRKSEKEVVLPNFSEILNNFELSKLNSNLFYENICCKTLTYYNRNHFNNHNNSNIPGLHNYPINSFINQAWPHYPPFLPTKLPVNTASHPPQKPQPQKTYNIDSLIN